MFTASVDFDDPALIKVTHIDAWAQKVWWGH